MGAVFHVVLHNPVIPPNTGNVLRTTAVAGAMLHLVEPLGFSLDDAHLRRAGLDYHDLAHVLIHPDFDHLARTVRGELPREQVRKARLSERQHAADPRTASTSGTANSEDASPAHPDNPHTALEIEPTGRIFAFTGHADLAFHDVAYRPGDALLLGTEPTGLPEDVLADERLTAAVRIPMRPGARSLNLSNAAAIALYEAWRQQGFAGRA